MPSPEVRHTACVSRGSLQGINASVHGRDGAETGKNEGMHLSSMVGLCGDQPSPPHLPKPFCCEQGNCLL